MHFVVKLIYSRGTCPSPPLTLELVEEDERKKEAQVKIARRLNDELKGLKARAKFDQGESSPNSHYL